METTYLVDPFEWWDRLALGLVQGGGNNAAILEVDVGLRSVFLPRQGMLHPFDVVALIKLGE